MKKYKQQPKHVLTRGKILLIGLLSFILFAVIVIQLEGPPSTKQTDGPKANDRVPAGHSQAPNDSNQAKPPISKEQKAVRGAVTMAWKSPDLSRVIAFNPFAMPKSFQSDRPTKTSRLLDPAELTRRRQIREEALAAERKEMRDRAIQEEIKRQRELYQAQVQDERVRIESRLAQIQQRGFDLVFTNRNQRLVKLGRLELRPGDVFDNIRVVAIRENGSVLLEPNFHPSPFQPDLSNFGDQSDTRKPDTSNESNTNARSELGLETDR